MPLGPPDAPEAFPDFETCVERLMEEGHTKEEAQRICGSWESNSNSNGDTIAAANAAVRRVSGNSPFDSSDDPTSTKTIRSRWSAEMYRRFRAIKSVIRTAVVEQDALGLEADAPRPTVIPDTPGSRIPWANRRRQLRANQGPGSVSPPGRRAFNYPRDDKKVDEFMRWLDGEVNSGVLEVTEFDGRDVAAHSEWQNQYVRAAYLKGTDNAEAAMNQAGIAAAGTTAEALFNRPQHADALGLLYTRSFRGLDGITRNMENDISRTLAEGLSQGWNPRRTASALNDRVGAIGLNRARMLARTETIRAANEAALNRYEDFGRRLQGVTVMQEFLTAGDNQVCDICASIEGDVFTIQDARGVIPLHPSCRCTWIPVTQ